VSTESILWITINRLPWLSLGKFSDWRKETVWVFLQTNDSDTVFWRAKQPNRRSQWTHGLRHRSAASRMLRLWVRIPSGAWFSICLECCVLSGRGLHEELITRPQKPYRLWCVVVCDLETTWMRGPWPNGGLLHQKTKQKTLWRSDVTIQIIIGME